MLFMKSGCQMYSRDETIRISRFQIWLKLPIIWDVSRFGVWFEIWHEDWPPKLDFRFAHHCYLVTTFCHINYSIQEFRVQIKVTMSQQKLFIAMNKPRENKTEKNTNLFRRYCDKVQTFSCKIDNICHTKCIWTQTDTHYLLSSQKPTHRHNAQYKCQADHSPEAEIPWHFADDLSHSCPC